MLVTDLAVHGRWNMQAHPGAHAMNPIVLQGCTWLHIHSHLPGPNRPGPFPSTTGPLNGHEVSGEMKSFRAAAVGDHAKALGKMTDDSAWREEGWDGG